MAKVKAYPVEFLSNEERELMQMDPAQDAGYITNDRVLEMDVEIARLRGALQGVMDELGVPSEGYPAPVVNAWTIAKRALNVGRK